jgi:hypothetical protein
MDDWATFWTVVWKGYPKTHFANYRGSANLFNANIPESGRATFDQLINAGNFRAQSAKTLARETKSKS